MRSVDAAEAVREADALGLAAVVLKSHAYPTGPVAILMQKTVERLRVFGGICCDFEVGGLNPAAVEVALRTGGKVVWLPTFSSVVRPPEARASRDRASRCSTTAGGWCRRSQEILRLVARARRACVATGHIDLPEQFAVVDAARELGVRVRDDARARDAGRSGPHARARASSSRDRGAMIEFTYLTCIPGGIAATEAPETFARAMMAVGPERAIMSTDFGQAKSPHPAEGMRLFLAEMLRCGVPPAALDLMARRNPARLLGLA